MRTKKGLKSKGQVLLITGLVMALGLYLVNTTVDFTGAIDVDGMRTGIEGELELRSLERGFRRMYQRTSEGGTDTDELNTKLKEFVVFARNRSGAKEIRYVFSTTAYYNSSHMKTTFHNFLDQSLENVEINATQCSANVPSNGGSCSLYLEETSGDEYTIEVSYEDSHGTGYTKRYSGLYGSQDNYSSVFYRTELQVDGTELITEESLWSRVIA